MPINVNGTDAAETLSATHTDLSGGNIDGGGGFDVLDLWDYFYPELFDLTTLTTFKNVEVIRGVLEEAQIRIRADQLANVTTIDSDGTEYLDQVIIVGNNIDLSAKTFVGRLEIVPETINASIKVADYAMASLIRSTVRGTKVEIASGTLTNEQRVILYDRGVDKIIDASGITEASSPVVTGLHGDALAYKSGEMFLDVGANATIQSIGHLQSLIVKFTGSKTSRDILDLEQNSRVKIQGMNADGNYRIFVDGVEIGDAFRTNYEGSLHFSFNGNATEGRIQEVIRSISYNYDSVFIPSSGSLGVEFTFQDAGGRVAKAVSTINFGKEISTQPNPAPVTPSAEIKGTNGNDVLVGTVGDDIIRGLKGRDTLTGSLGKDSFVFDTKPGKSNIDKITDFSVKDDTIWLENVVFTKLGKKAGVLKKGNFFKGDAAKDKDDYIVFDPKKGALYYDQDGSGSMKAVQIATLNKKLPLTHKDFLII